MILIDSSGFYAIADVEDPNHSRASDAMRAALAGREPIMTHNYVVAECTALIQRRLGLQAALAYLNAMRLLHVHWVSRSEHDEAVELFEERNRRGLSLVDCVSFVVMRALSIDTALAYDGDFAREGFRVA